MIYVHALNILTPGSISEVPDGCQAATSCCVKWTKSDLNILLMLPPLHSTSPHLSEESVCSSLRRSHQESQAQLVYSGDEFKDFSQVSDPKSTSVTACLYT